MKIQLELNIPDDRIFLNFWNWYNADDVVCELKEGKLLLGDKEISIEEFCLLVKSKVEQIPKQTN